MKSMKNMAGALVAVALLSVTLFADTGAAARYDNQAQNAVAQKLSSKKQFRDVKASVEDGIVTLTGTVDLYQRKLDAEKLASKLRYVRVGYDNTFNYFALGVKDGVVTVEGQDRTGVGRDEALADIA